MAEQKSKQLIARSVELAATSPYHPRLGDLALDVAQGGQIGVVVALPSDTTASYQLRPPGGGEDWRANSNGTTLRPVAVPVTHVTPQKRDAFYDKRAEQAALPVNVHHEDGGTSEALLILTPAQIAVYLTQFERLLERRENTR